MTFKEWRSKVTLDGTVMMCSEEAIWQAAQEAMRERAAEKAAGVSRGNEAAVLIAALPVE